MDLTINIIGWIGSALLVSAYWLNSRNKINAQMFSYQFLNIVGSITLMINTLYFGAYPSSSVNIIWLIIGFYNMSKILKV